MKKALHRKHGLSWIASQVNVSSKHDLFWTHTETRAFIQGQSQANKGGAARGKPPASSASKAKDGADRSRSAEASASTATGTGTNPTGAGTSQPVIQFR